MRRILALAAAAALLVGCSGGSATTGAATPNPTDTPANSSPSDAPATTPEASVEASLEPDFAEIALTGKGKKVVKFDIPEGVPGLAVMTHNGESNFIVEALDASGDSLGSVVNEIGDYSGTVLFDKELDQHTVAFAVDADGPWTITVKPVTSAPAWDPSTTLKGTGDSVYQLSPASSGLVVLDMTFTGEDNFIVHAYGPDSGEGIANEIGNFSGQVPLPDGTVLLEIIANGGAWTITPG